MAEGCCCGDQCAPGEELVAQRPVSMGVLSVWQTMRRMENAAGINKERAMLLHVYRLSTSLFYSGLNAHRFISR